MGKTVALLVSMAVALVFASGVALAVTTAEGDASGDVVGRDAALDGALKALVERRGGPPGAIAVVQRGNHREVHAFGVRNVEKDLPMRPDARMRMASTSKAFNGAVALSLLGEGKLTLNDTVGEYGRAPRR